MPKYGFISERKYILREVIRLKEILFDFDGSNYKCSAKSAFLPKSRLQVYFLENKEQFDDLTTYFLSLKMEDFCLITIQDLQFIHLRQLKCFQIFFGFQI